MFSPLGPVIVALSDPPPAFPVSISNEEGEFTAAEFKPLPWAITKFVSHLILSAFMLNKGFCEVQYKRTEKNLHQLIKEIIFKPKCKPTKKAKDIMNKNKTKNKHIKNIIEATEASVECPCIFFRFLEEAKFRLYIKCSA
ncbi:hypothetical protein BpHYR1_046779 [Brachionus plicatilis]|uniref:Uncharacterized protein n=1 Tax=Brachionus plicatilis TaxID=10195 RepID=A0A3M7SAK9_BRAPC|nr:hypothetical protein BpHYR1_046779 [Brachionus plicatilis]